MHQIMAYLQPSLFILLINLGCFPIFSTNPNPNPKPHKNLLSCLLSFRKPKAAAKISSSSSPLCTLHSPVPNANKNVVDVIYPCNTCGEVLTKPHLLDVHQNTKHSSLLSELKDCDDIQYAGAKNIVEIIFRSGWKGECPPTIHRVFKIHNSAKALARFEEYRETVRSRGGAAGDHDDDARRVADGNERLRFHLMTAVCGLVGGVCGSPYCGTCGVVRQGFVGKQWGVEYGIGTHVSGWGAHVHGSVERELGFLHVRRAVVVCRVVAGRVARGGGGVENYNNCEQVFDSVVVEGSDELLVFNPSALLPCFIVIYSA